jgi:hypothetical protein
LVRVITSKSSIIPQTFNEAVTFVLKIDELVNLTVTVFHNTTFHVVNHVHELLISNSHHVTLTADDVLIHAILNEADSTTVFNDTHV